MRSLWRLIAGLFKGFWRLINFIREVILNLFLIVLLLIVASVYLGYTLNNESNVIPKGALIVDISGSIVDKPALNSKISKISRLLLGTDDMRENSLFDIVDMLRQAKNDNAITGIVLDLRHFTGGDIPSMQYVGKVLREFRDSGKPVYAVGDSFTQAQYYLASFANKIYLSPLGGVELRGLATEGIYYKSLMDKLKVTTNVFRVGTYKSAVEPFLRDDMSPEAREADSRWINQLWGNYLNTVAANRQLTPGQAFPGATAILAALQANGGDTARLAREAKLVDVVASRYEIEKQLADVFGHNNITGSFIGTSIYDYPLHSASEKSAAEANIAVIMVNGAIMDGEEKQGNVGADTTAQEIRQARLSPKIKAIILRVNSPGGSVIASEIIREELMAAKESGKPVVVSMGGMAASGGYWVSTPANYIIASPSTLTGSIGIFGVINTFENTLDAIGVHSDGVDTSPLARLSMTRALPTEVQQMMQQSVENGYQRFLSLVAISRGKTPLQIDAIAQGRVWTGSDAKQNGLVDSLGDFDDAVSKATELAGLKTAHLSWRQTTPDYFDLLVNSISTSAYAVLPGVLKSYFPAPAVELMNTVRQHTALDATLNDPGNRYVLCLACEQVK
ncbi:MAG: Protease 4 [Candidatus Erwinia impunctatus]|nr:Protease 4 [Culicoides impunctatus]